MSWWNKNRTAPFDLTGKGVFVSTQTRKKTGIIWGIVGLMSLIASLLAGQHYFSNQSRQAAQAEHWEQETKVLQALLSQQKTELEVERATRAALEKQLGAQTESLRQAQEELRFFKTTAAKTQDARKK